MVLKIRPQSYRFGWINENRKLIIVFYYTNYSQYFTSIIYCIFAPNLKKVRI